MILLNKFIFNRICNIEPQKKDGEIFIYFPQERYKNDKKLSLHKFGKGSFCKFMIPRLCKNLTGVYALVSKDKIIYIGRCHDLLNRFNIGYGNISPKNCFIGGQSTNCKINKNILNAVREGKKIDLYFFESKSKYEEIEKELIKQLQPKWNSQLK